MQPLFKMFPNVSDIKTLTTFLTDVFRLNEASIPQKLTDCPPAKLSGGEIQRYVLAHHIWMIQQVKPDCVFLDEVDRALDKDTAIHIVRWIVRTIPAYHTIVSHLTEVKEMLHKEGLIDLVWKYENDGNRINIVQTSY